MQDTTFMTKWQDLLLVLKSKGKVAIACSGGLDSRLLTYAVKLADIPYKILHAKGVHIPLEEEEILAEFARKIEINIESININPLEITEISNNPIDRCYHCKAKIFSILKEKAGDYQICDGSNTDDLKVYRPGHKALKELEVFSPYLEANISKDDIYKIAKEVALPYSSQMAQACLLTRFNYNLPLDKTSILWIDRAERELKGYISTPFRIRGIEKDSYQLHIEGDSTIYKDRILNIEKKLCTLAKENVNINTQIDILFFDSLRSYFDKKHDIS